MLSSIYQEKFQHITQENRIKTAETDLHSKKQVYKLCQLDGWTSLLVTWASHKSDGFI